MDWAELFNLENIITIIRGLLDGGILAWAAAMIVKWKNTRTLIEKSVKESVCENIGDVAGKAILSSVESAITPIYESIATKLTENNEAMAAVVKCIALMQQDTPESKVAILDELSKLSVCGNTQTNEEIKKFIVETTIKLKEEIENQISSLKLISESNQKIIDDSKEKNNEKETDKEVTNAYDGTSI